MPPSTNKEIPTNTPEGVKQDPEKSEQGQEGQNGENTPVKQAEISSAKRTPSGSRGRGRLGRGSRGRGSLVSSKAVNNSVNNSDGKSEWTGAGFDVDE